MSKLLGAGGHSCVYSPPLDREYCGKFGDEFVSKLVDKRDYETAKHVEEILHNLDPDNRWHLGLVKVCEYRKELPGDCSPLARVEDQNLFYNLIYPRVLGSVEKLGTKGEEVSVSEFLEAFITLLKGVRKLHRNNYVHLDIKPENILYDRDDKTGYFRLYLSDYDLFRENTGFMPEEEIYPYVYWPMEVMFYYILFPDQQFHRVVNLARDYRNNPQIYPRRNAEQLYSELRKYSDYDFSALKEDMEEEFYKFNNYRARITNPAFYSLADIDRFGLGMVLHRAVYNNKRFWKPSIAIDLELMAESFTDPYLPKRRNPYSEESIAELEMLRDMSA